MLPSPHRQLPQTPTVSPSSVHAHESNPEISHDTVAVGIRTPTELELTFRHNGWRETRRRVFSALSNTSAGLNRLHRFANCGCGCWIHRTTTHPRQYKLSANYCHDRFCTPCSRANGRVIGSNIQAATKNRTVRFLTLTKRSADDVLDETLNDLADAFRRLRSRKAWKNKVTGGVSFLEVKWNADPGRWHAHLHVLIEGRYWDQREIAAEWLACTGDSHVVDIRAVPEGDAMIKYITKYATKGIDNKTTHDPPRLREAITALHGRRSCTTFGTWRGIPLQHNDVDGEWESWITLAELIARKDAGNGWASIIYSQITRQTPWNRHLNPRSPPVELSPGGH